MLYDEFYPHVEQFHSKDYQVYPQHSWLSWRVSSLLVLLRKVLLSEIWSSLRGLLPHSSPSQYTDSPSLKRFLYSIRNMHENTCMHQDIIAVDDLCDSLRLQLRSWIIYTFKRLFILDNVGMTHVGEDFNFFLSFLPLFRWHLSKWEGQIMWKSNVVKRSSNQHWYCGILYKGFLL